MPPFGRRIAPEPVYINVYDLSPYNESLVPFGLGVYHSGIQVHGKEYTFGSQTHGTGIFSHEPKHVPNARFRVSIVVGTVTASSNEIDRLVDSLKPDWPGSSYHVMKKNCNSFSEELTNRLVGGHIPGWVNRLSYIGNQLSCCIPDSFWNNGNQAPVTNPSANSGSSNNGSTGNDNGSGSSSRSGGGGTVFRTGSTAASTNRSSQISNSVGYRLGDGSTGTNSSSSTTTVSSFGSSSTTTNSNSTTSRNSSNGGNGGVRTISSLTSSVSNTSTVTVANTTKSVASQAYSNGNGTVFASDPLPSSSSSSASIASASTTKINSVSPPLLPPPPKTNGSSLGSVRSLTSTVVSLPSSSISSSSSTTNARELMLQAAMKRSNDNKEKDTERLL